MRYMAIALVCGLNGCRSTPESAAKWTPNIPASHVTTVKDAGFDWSFPQSREGLWIDSERIHLVGRGDLTIPYGGDPFYRQISGWANPDKVSYGVDGAFAIGELTGSEEINTYLFGSNTRMVAVVSGWDQSDFQFTKDGKSLVVVSYDRLDVVDCATGEKTTRNFASVQPGDKSSWSIRLVPGGQGRFARVLRTVYKPSSEFSVLSWWDPIADRSVPAPIESHPSEFVWKAGERFFATRKGQGSGGFIAYQAADKTRYVIEDAVTRKPLGEIRSTRMIAFVGDHGLYTGGVLYDLRSLKRIATIKAEVDRSLYLISTRDGYFFGNMDPKKHGLDEGKRDPERVRRTLIDGLGLEEPDSMSP